MIVLYANNGAQSCRAFAWNGLAGEYDKCWLQRDNYKIENPQKCAYPDPNDPSKQAEDHSSYRYYMIDY